MISIGKRSKMRWNHKTPKIGDERIRTFFAWLPVKSKKTEERRWLETVSVLEQYDDFFYKNREVLYTTKI